MSISINSPVLSSTFWLDFKAVVQSKDLLIQYDDDSSIYTIFAIDGPISYVCNIWKSTIPQSLINSGLYSQAQNDSDKADFESNFKPSANRNLQYQNPGGNNRAVVGTISALSQTVNMSTLGIGAIGIQFSGTWVGTITFESTVDNVVWNPFFVSQLFVVGLVNTATVNAFFRGRNSGFSQIRMRASAWTSGTLNITVQGVVGTGAVLADQGTPASIANAWPCYLTDGTRGPVTIKAASTAPVAADLASVTVISPNQQPIPVFQQELGSFIVTSAGTAAGNGKSMLSLMNAGGSTVTIKIRRIYIKIVTGTALGPDLFFELHKITSHASGSLVTPLANSSSDSLNASVTARVGSTVGGEGGLIDRWVLRSLDTTFAPYQSFPVFDTLPASISKPFYLLAGEGIHIKCATNSTAGTWDVVYHFTQE